MGQPQGQGWLGRAGWAGLALGSASHSQLREPWRTEMDRGNSCS